MEEYNNVQRLGESRNDIYWILYQTINLQNNKIYIGVHKTKNPYENCYFIRTINLTAVPP